MPLRRSSQMVNGVERFFTYDSDKDTLADVLRRYGLTGVKVGCASGQCGACSVILNGEVVRSCVKRMKNVSDFSEITTIEGVGTPKCLHPLQQAWITYGGVQCGFCTPGFIVSAYALLQKNVNPSREEVREWFYERRNICRCTGYRPLVDAVMAAAAVMRGEKTMEDITYQMPEDGKIYGTRYPKPTALSKVTGLCDYGDDIGLKMPPGTLHLAVVMPETYHANIKNIDYSAAEAMPGVVKVITAKDVPAPNQVPAPFSHPRSEVDRCVRPLIADKTIFRYGDVAAVVAAQTEEEARAAAKKVRVELEELPVYYTAVEAVSPGAQEIHKGINNQFCVQPLYKGDGDIDKVFAAAPYVVEGSFYSSREPHLPMEPDTMQAYVDDEGRVTVQCRSQTLHANRSVVAAGLGLQPEQVRLIENPTGGSFGSAMTASSYALAAACTMILQQPVTLTMSYPEHTHFSGKRAQSFANARLACDENGKILAWDFDTLFDMGAYPEMAGSMSTKCVRFMGYPYHIPLMRGCGRLGFSNVSFCTAYRAFGSPQAYTTSEALVDMMAAKIGMDPLEFRYINVAQPGDDYVCSVPYKGYPMRQLLDMMRPHYQAAKKRAAELSTPEKKRGVGIVAGGYHAGIANDNCTIYLELNPDGTVSNYNSWEAQGQGADAGSLVCTHEALRPLGLRPDQIRLIQNDTAITPNTGPAAGSRSHYMAGNATNDAAKKLINAMRKEDGTFRTYDEMVAEGIPTKYEGFFTTVGMTSGLDPNTGHGNPAPEDMFTTYMAEVEVDTATGKVRVLSMKSACDVGVIGNRLGVEGQAYGGSSHSIGFALTEDYGDMKQHSSLKACGVPTIKDIPDDFEFMFLETNPREHGPYGGSGASECFQNNAHMSVINAIYDAVGVRIYDLPATPEKVQAAMEAKARGEEIKPAKYYFGNTLEEMLDYCKVNPK